MTTALQDLVDKRVQLITNAREFLLECQADHDGLTEAEDARWSTMLGDSDTIKGEIDTAVADQNATADRLSRQQAAEDELDKFQNPEVVNRLRDATTTHSGPRRQQPANIENPLDRVINAWGRGGRLAVESDPEIKAAFGQSGATWDNDAGGLYIPLMNHAPKTLADIQNAQSIGTTTEGGHTTFPGFIATLERALLAFGAMRSVSTILRTATGSALDYPTVDDTSNTGALLSENVQDSEQDVTFGNLTLDAYQYTSKIVRVSKQLMQDSAFNMGEVVGSLLGERLGRIENTHATTGTGTSQPNGIVTASTAGKTAAATGTVTFLELKDLKSSVDPAYRPGSSWMFNDATRNTISQITDGNTNFYWQPSVIAEEPDRLLNHPTFVNQDMVSMAAATKSILFGLLSKYLMREVLGVTLVQLNERYADYHQVGFVAITRFDADLLDAGTNPVKHMLQAAA